MNLYVHTTEEQKHKEIDLIADALKVIQSLFFCPLKLVRKWYVNQIFEGWKSEYSKKLVRNQMAKLQKARKIKGF